MNISLKELLSQTSGTSEPSEHDYSQAPHLDDKYARTDELLIGRTIVATAFAASRTDPVKTSILLTLDDGSIVMILYELIGFADGPLSMTAPLTHTAPLQKQ